jgi:hypothetical protein
MVQVPPIKPTLKAPGIKGLKLRCDDPPSNFAFKFNFRRYTPVRVEDVTGASARTPGAGVSNSKDRSTLLHFRGIVPG